jgi:hypothetical protein
MMSEPKANDPKWKMMLQYPLQSKQLPGLFEPPEISVKYHFPVAFAIAYWEHAVMKSLIQINMKMK